MVPWAEPSGDSVSGRYGSHTFIKIRRFVVVRPRPGFCLCLAIHTYQGRATTKPGVRPEDHAAVVAEGEAPRLAPGELPLRKDPMFIKVENDSTGTIDPMSRINFAKVYTVEYNVKARNVGRILSDSIWRMDRYFAQCLGHEIGEE